MTGIQFFGAVLIALGLALYVAEPLVDWMIGRG